MVTVVRLRTLICHDALFANVHAVQHGSVHGRGVPKVLMEHTALRRSNFATLPHIVDLN